MADEEARGPGPFNVDTIHQLIKLMSRHDLSEILLEEGDARIRLRRGQPETVVTAPAVVPAVFPSPTQPTVPAAPPAPRFVEESPAKSTLHEIKSPMIGTFYNREKPDAEPYVKVGSRVAPTTVVGLIEAMKLFNEVAADCNGVIREVLVENASAVDFNTVLFRVDTAG